MNKKGKYYALWTLALYYICNVFWVHFLINRNAFLLILSNVDEFRYTQFWKQKKNESDVMLEQKSYEEP